MTDELKISNKKIIDFYKKYSSLNFENVNLKFVEIFENILNDANGVIDNSILTSMLSKLQESNHNAEKTLAQLQNITEINRLSNEKHSKEISTIEVILNQIKTSALENSNNLKSELSSNIMQQLSQKQISQEHIGHIRSVMESQFNNYLDKTKVFYMSKLPEMINNTNQPLLQTITASEERINNSLSEIKEKSTINSENTVELKNSLTEHILNSKTSSRKGDISENKLLPILNQIFPTDEVIHNGSGKQAHCCDYTINRNKGKNILIENKDYITNLGPDNIRKFIDDIERNNCHGIFISQQSGISGKSNYKIDIHKNNVLVYLHNVNYDIGKIKASVEIIDQLSERLNEIDMDENNISKDDLNSINTEFSNFIESKENIIKMVNDFQKKLCTSLKQLNFSCLEKYLGSKFAHLKTFNFECDICGKGWDTRRALAAHRKGCIKIHLNKSNEDTEVIQIET